MQQEAWMIQLLFSNLITHFINCLSRRRGISSKKIPLLIWDGHNFHVSLEMVMKAMEVGLDLVMLPFHTSHYLQPLIVNILHHLENPSNATKTHRY